MRALPVALTLMDRARAWKHGKDLGNRLTGQAFGLPGRVLTEGPAAGAASQIPAGCNPEVYNEGSWSRVDARAGQLGVTGPTAIYAGIRGARGR